MQLFLTLELLYVFIWLKKPFLTVKMLIKECGKYVEI